MSAHGKVRWSPLGRAAVALVLMLLGTPPAWPDAQAPLPLVEKVDAQPLLAQVARVVQAMALLGEPISASTQAALDKAAQETDPALAVKEVQAALDPYCLLGTDTDPNSPLQIAPGPAAPVLVEQGWRLFVVKVYNEAGVRRFLTASSPNAQPLAGAPSSDVANRWCDIQMYSKQPLDLQLSGLELEYRPILLYSRDAGQRTASLSFDSGKHSLAISFNCVPSSEVTFRVRDENGQPATAMLVIHDTQGRLYPPATRRLAPDLAFQPQIYRGDGEVVRLPAGTYQIAYARGPEYLPGTQTVTVTGGPQTVAFPLTRWIDPSRLGWWSGDYHIHAAGCSHYTNPTEGVFPADMIRHCMGEDLKISDTLTWGPCFDFQKQFFTGTVDKVSQPPYLMRYDIEVSGFGSYKSGHLCLLGLKQQIYPGGDSDTHWPTLCLNTLKWAKAQGAICGYPHSGWGLHVKSADLPNYIVPPYDDIGAMEYIVDVTHQVPGPAGSLVPAVDFMSAADTPSVWELNMWYHTLNCGFRTRLGGETDFPCITDQHVGAGRTYVKLDGPLTLDAWLAGIQQGRAYVSDGRSHLMDYRVDPAPPSGPPSPGRGGAGGEVGSELRLAQPGTVHVTAKVAALLDPTPNAAIRKLKYDAAPYWHLERARVGTTRQVPVEVIVNGYPVAQTLIEADGQIRDVVFDVPIARSSWVALRILPSSHTNPVFVVVGDKPIRASKRSADWCLKGVDQCWSQKKQFIQATEMDDAVQAYDHARAVYQQILNESDVD